MAKASPLSEEWYYKALGEEFGPLSFDEMRLSTRDGPIGPDTFVRRGRNGRWVLAERVGGLFDGVEDFSESRPPGPPAPKQGTRNCVAPPPAPKAEWFYLRGDRRLGPVTLPALKWLRTVGDLAPTDLVWREGMTNWQPAAILDQEG